MFDPWERDAWLPPPEETVDQWAERSLVLPRQVSSMPGLLSFQHTPFIREPLAAATDVETEEICLCCSTQIMKTTYLIVVALHTVAEDPWNIMHVMATENDAEELSIERYQPIIRKSPLLSAFLDGSKHQMTREAIRLNGCIITFRGAYSPAGLASRSISKLFLDEVDKWPEWSGKEADPIKLARERVRTFRYSRKVISASTPTTEDRYIWSLLQGTTNERFWVPCPECGGFQKLEFSQLKWPEGESAEAIQKQHLAFYECAYCSARLTDRQRPGMLASGKWFSEHQKVSRDGTASAPPGRLQVGYHLWAGYSPWLGFSEIVGEYIRSQANEPAQMNFTNSWLAQPWKQTIGEVREDYLREHVDPELFQGRVPREAVCLTAGVDVQSRSGLTYLYYALRAWGKEDESWLVRAGIAESWEALLRILLHTQYRSPDGRVVPVVVLLIDSGYRTNEVYGVCRETGAIAYKGDTKSMRHLRVAPINPWPGSEDQILLAVADPNSFKGKLHRLIRTPGKWHLPADLDEEYYAHMVSEQQVRELNRRTNKMQVLWRVVVPGRANHYFDSEVMALVGAEIVLVQSQGAETAPAPRQPEPITTVEGEPESGLRRTVSRTFS